MSDATKPSPARQTPVVIAKLRSHLSTRYERDPASNHPRAIAGARGHATAGALLAAILVGAVGVTSCADREYEGPTRRGGVPVGDAGARPSTTQAAAGSLMGQGGADVIAVGGSAIAVGGGALSVTDSAGGAGPTTQDQDPNYVAVAGAPGGLGVAGSTTVASTIDPLVPPVPGCGECLPPTPLCNPETRECVACINDTNCAAPTPACSSSNACVECTQNAQCSGAEPICNSAANSCVQCLGNEHCTSVAGKPNCSPTDNVCVGCLVDADCGGSQSTPFCNPTSRSCVACQSNVDCTEAAASRCDFVSDTCGPCASDTDCSQIAGKSICLLGKQGQPNRCVQCTAANEQACIVGATEYSCNPAENLCTSTPKGSLTKCQPCLADSECMFGDIASPTARCVPMTFKGQKHGVGGYCLQRRAAKGCTNMYVVLFSAESLSGEPAENYCGINQKGTTCEAVLDMVGWKSCSMDSDCGGMEGGLCRNFSLPTAPPDFRCTIQCSEALECTAVRTCGLAPFDYCH